MGRLKNGLNGPFTGKVGTVVGATWRGVEYVRSRPKASTKKASAGQLKQRARMSLISSWLKAVNDLILVGFQRIVLGKTEMNLATSYNMKEALTEDNGCPVIDFPKAIFSRGELLASVVLEMLPLEGPLLNIKWINANESGMNKGDDKATFVIYNPVSSEFVTFENVADRADQEVMLRLPSSFKTHRVHCYMQLVNQAGNEVSTTVYAGEVTVV